MPSNSSALAISSGSTADAHTDSNVSHSVSTEGTTELSWAAAASSQSIGRRRPFDVGTPQSYTLSALMLLLPLTRRAGSADRSRQRALGRPVRNGPPGAQGAVHLIKRADRPVHGEV